MIKVTKYKALDVEVLAVASLTIRDGDVAVWTVYVGSVDGENHDVEKHEVRKHGCKQPKNLGTLIFPNLPADKYDDR